MLASAATSVASPQGGREARGESIMVGAEKNALVLSAYN